VVKGQLTGPQVVADQQVMTRGRRGPRRPVPAVSFGSLPGGADLPAPRGLQQLPGDLRAAERRPAGECEAEAGRHPQHIPLAVCFEELPHIAWCTVLIPFSTPPALPCAAAGPGGGHAL
jgi:hypothetical protein